MRSMIIGVAIIAICMFGANSSAGTWRYNAAKSKTTSTNPIRSQTEVREETIDGGEKVTRTGQLTDGTSLNSSYTFKYDGKTRTQTSTGSDATGKTVTSTLVFDKQ